MASSVEEMFVTVHGVTTQLLKCGELDDRNQLILVIPGNPGVPGFYREFIQHLHDGSARTPVWVMSHAGHVTPLTQQKAPPSLYSLSDQVRHKRAFIEQLVPRTCRVVLVGHSIGCYIILRLLAGDGGHEDRRLCDGDLADGRLAATDTAAVPPPTSVAGRTVTRALLLFPTVERMRDSPQGRWVAPVVSQWLVAGVARLLHMLPESWLRYAVERNVGATAAAATVTTALRMLSDAAGVANVLAMVRDEMRDVCVADHDTIARHVDTLRFYYGATDAWCPVRYHDEMRARHPRAHIRLCERDIAHAFVLRASAQMAQTVNEWCDDMLTRADGTTDEGSPTHDTTT